MGTRAALACDRPSAMLGASMHLPRPLALLAPRAASFFSRPAQTALGLSLVACAACGSPPPPSGPAAPPPPSATAPAPPPPPDLTPTPEPEGLIAFARASKPSEALKVIGAWVQMAMPGPAEVGSLVAGESTGNLIDL